MRQFLYLCLLGTALVGSSEVFSASYKWGSDSKSSSNGAYSSVSEALKESALTETATGGDYFDTGKLFSDIKDSSGTVIATRTINSKDFKSTFTLTDAGKEAGWSVENGSLTKSALSSSGSLTAGAPTVSRDLNGTTTTATEFSSNGKVMYEKWELSDGTERYVVTNEGAKAGYKATDGGIEGPGISSEKVATPATNNNGSGSSSGEAPSPAAGGSTPAAADAANNASPKLLEITEEEELSYVEKFEDGTTGKITYKAKSKDGSISYERVVDKDGNVVSTKEIDNETGEWTGTDANGNKTVETIFGQDVDGKDITQVQTTTDGSTSVKFYKGDKEISASEAASAVSGSGDIKTETTVLGKDDFGNEIKRVETTTEDITTVEFYRGNEKISASDSVRLKTSDATQTGNTEIVTYPDASTQTTTKFSDGSTKTVLKDSDGNVTKTTVTQTDGSSTVTMANGDKYSVDKNGNWKGTDGSVKGKTGYVKQNGDYATGNRYSKSTLSDGTTQLKDGYDNSTTLTTKDGYTTKFTEGGNVVYYGKTNGKTDGKWTTGLSDGGTAAAGSYSWSGEVYNSGTLGFKKTQVYRDSNTGQYFTGSVGENGNIKVENAYTSVGTTAGEYSAQYDLNSKSSILVGSNGKSFSKFVDSGTVVGSNGSTNVKWENGVFTDGNQTYTYDAKTQTFTGQDGTKIEANEDMTKAVKEADEAKAAATAASKLPDKAVTQNAVEYGITIAEAVVGNEKADLTENTTVQGAEQVVEAQDSTHTSKIVSATKDDALSATTISSAANVMIALLNANPLDLTMLDDDACNTGTGSAGQGTTTGASTGGIDTTAYKKCIKNKRALFAQTVAVASQIIAEGSNAVSSKFYDRVNQLMTEANGQYTSEFADAHGSLGAISVVNDAERYPYFEMVRGAALSAVQLTAKGAENLVELDVEINTEEGGK